MKLYKRCWADVRGGTKERHFITWHTEEQMKKIGECKVPGKISIDYEKIEHFDNLQDFFNAQHV